MSSQFYIALAIHEQFEELGVEYESWRCCAGMLHYCAVKDDKKKKSSLMMDHTVSVVVNKYL